ncbi:hypothetical protein ACFSBZ_02315 [Amnibacterium flavum]|nr:hypothetical protein [Amnibacterium flavum]
MRKHEIAPLILGLVVAGLVSIGAYTLKNLTVLLIVPALVAIMLTARIIRDHVRAGRGGETGPHVPNQGQDGSDARTGEAVPPSGSSLS